MKFLYIQHPTVNQELASRAIVSVDHACRNLAKYDWEQVSYKLYLVTSSNDRRIKRRKEGNYVIDFTNRIQPL
ncbi:uncharacterized protein C8R40DRAFT_1086748 [Lentinula edodes]|uniref:uncharacterized protein n=1 Tax=Lentinula edodes TaxID=5353 RepID=UPI001E8D9DC5|nr:uncharacterized protein C8R40DRAFT_1086748 [Lentinula edodes]KAH7879464.1 hypothetical protein C8R40DRAFT_1086748 [Lentinula edodes]